MNVFIGSKLFQNLAIFLPLLVLMIPILMYLTSGWILRRREILTSFTDEAIEQYFRTFFQTAYRASFLSKPIPNDLVRKKLKDASPSESNEHKSDINNLRRKFNENFSKCFGRIRFVIPGTLLTVLTGALLHFWVQIIIQYSSPLKYSEPSGLVFALAGFAGGYMWILFSLIKRVQERQLNPADLYWSCFRIIISIPVALSLAKISPKGMEIPVAFMTGAFPTMTLITFMRRTVSDKLKMQESFDDQATSLTKLQGIDRNQAEAFGLEGVSSILQLAYSDPVDLTIRTGFSFSYVVDCCSQALAWLYFEDNLPVMRRYGLRGAQEICTLVKELERFNNPKKETKDKEEAWANQTLTKIAEELKMDNLVLRRMLDDIAYDPYAQFLYDIWQSDWN